MTLGASTTALLGLITGFGLADRFGAGPDAVAAPDSLDTAIAVAQPALTPSMLPAATTPEPTPAIVIVIDRATGAIVSSETVESLDQAVADAVGRPVPIPADTASGATDVGSSARPAPPTGPEAVSEPQPVAEPTRIDLAVPAPPPVQTPNVAAEPQASSDAS